MRRAAARVRAVATATAASTRSRRARLRFPSDLRSRDPSDGAGPDGRPPLAIGRLLQFPSRSLSMRQLHAERTGHLQADTGQVGCPGLRCMWVSVHSRTGEPLPPVIPQLPAPVPHDGGARRLSARHSASAQPGRTRLTSWLVRRHRRRLHGGSTAVLGAVPLDPSPGGRSRLASRHLRPRHRSEPAAGLPRLSGPCHPGPSGGRHPVRSGLSGQHRGGPAVPPPPAHCVTCGGDPGPGTQLRPGDVLRFILLRLVVFGRHRS